MAKDNAVSKRLKISKAQQNMLGAVAIASLILGVSLVLGVYFVKYIRFNAAVIGAKNEAIQGYSDAIRDLGVCEAPRGRTYSSNELKSCEPDNVMPSDVTNSLRYNVMVKMAQNRALESVGRTGLSICNNSDTGEKLTYEQLYDMYDYATTSEDKARKLEIFGLCSALRAIPDALPATKNEQALGASLDRVYRIGNIYPDSITTGGEVETGVEGLRGIGMTLSVEAGEETAYRLLKNIERSIREFNINMASMEIVGGSGINLTASATAYYIDTAALTEGIVTVTGKGKVTKSVGSLEVEE